MIEVILKAFLSSFLATLGFGILFNIKGKNLLWASITGAIGGSVYKLCIYLNINDYVSNFLAAMCLSFCSEILARKYKNPVTTYIVCSLIPLVPGAALYRMMTYAMRGVLLKALERGCYMIGVAGSLAVGILLVSTFFKIYSQCKTKRESVC
ncbi:threonine/serine exporter family protein [Floccifex sp.]|uniref:threonine/serine exporter family protein n=1 Tax=Floccifex sp. TaxID=2815810 RepID=UPI003F01B857